jgi:hypothetical protein
MLALQTTFGNLSAGFQCAINFYPTYVSQDQRRAVATDPNTCARMYMPKR